MRDFKLRLRFILELSEPPTEETSKTLHNYIDFMLACNMTETRDIVFVIDEDGRGFETTLSKNKLILE